VKRASPEALGTMSGVGYVEESMTGFRSVAGFADGKEAVRSRLI
jgi:hypothetical protein